MQRPKVDIEKVIFKCTLDAAGLNCIDCRCTEDECIDNIIFTLEEFRRKEDEV